MRQGSGGLVSQPDLAQWVNFILKSVFKMVFLLTMGSFMSCSTIIVSNHQISLPPKTVILTFDDGPNRTFETTQRLLDVLLKHKVKAHFCLIGENIPESKHLIKRMHDEGHSLVNHSCEHRSVVFQNSHTIANDIARWDNLLQEAITTEKTTVTLYRPPFGIYTNSLKKVLDDKHMQILPLSFYTFDSQTHPSKAHSVQKNIVKELEKRQGGIIVLHDGAGLEKKSQEKLKKNSDAPYNRQWIPEITDSLIIILKDMGYTFTLFGNL